MKTIDLKEYITDRKKNQKALNTFQVHDCNFGESDIYYFLLEIESIEKSLTSTPY